MNTVDCILKLEAGEPIPKETPVSRRGWKPFRLATGKPTKKGEIVVVLECGARRHFTPTSLRYGDDTLSDRPVKA